MFLCGSGSQQASRSASITTREAFPGFEKKGVVVVVVVTFWLFGLLVSGNRPKKTSGKRLRQILAIAYILSLVLLALGLANEPHLIVGFYTEVCGRLNPTNVRDGHRHHNPHNQQQQVTRRISSTLTCWMTIKTLTRARTEGRNTKVMISRCL